MIISILLLIVGFILLIKGADIFVDGASATALNFKVPKILIGLTIVAFGTSAPEFAVSMSAIANHSTDMVLGNVIGSCILNVLLIIGIAAVIKPIKIQDNTVKKEIPLILLISTLLVVVMLDIKLSNGLTNQISRSDGIIIILFFTIFVYYLVSLARRKKGESEELTPTIPLWKSFLFVGLGLAGIIYGSDLVVENAKIFAKQIGLSERVISLSIIAFGTSLPELVTTIVSSKKGEQDLLLGNIIGSNIFNICVVLGVPVAIYGTITPSSFGAVDLVGLIISAILLFLFSLSKKTINRLEGTLLLFLFVIYYLLVFII